jgi:hypothetical protein
LFSARGTGKTASIGAALKRVATRWHARQRSLTTATSLGPFVVCSWTGVAAANVGFGGQTICSIFKFNGNEIPEGDNFDIVCDALVDLELLVIDEVSMLEPNKLALLSVLLDRCRRRNEERTDLMPSGFGNYHMLLSGDFAQLQPVGTSLLSPNLRGQSLLGRRLFDSFTTVLKLRRVYRQQCATTFDSDFRDSTLRLRDAAPTAADLELWKTRQLTQLAASESVEPYYHPDAIWLCAENKLAGTRNADVLVNLATASPATGLLDAAPPTIYETVAAYPGTRRADRRAAKDFKQVRHRLRWCVGCRVMLVQNRLYGVELPRLGLMNGAMGTIVAAYWEDNPMAPGKTPVLLVRFPKYTGDAVYDFDPKVIPVRCEEVRSNTNSAVIRWQLPLRLAHGITGHKSQGLSLEDYVVVDCRTTTRRAATATCGWAFVCFTRCCHPTKLAFVDLPEAADFVAPRSGLFFLAREEFETFTDKLHEQTLRDCGVDSELVKHLEAAPKSQHAQIKCMLLARGVAPVPACTQTLLDGGPAATGQRGQLEILVKKKDLVLQKSGY